jgi:pantothenate kinase-related protein Tda10
VEGYVDSGVPLLVTGLMKRTYTRVQKDDSPVKWFIGGPYGVGKSMTLLVVGHMARKS